MKYFLLFLIFPVFFSCTRQSQKSADAPTRDAESPVTISQQRFINETSPNTFTITQCELKGDYLDVTISASGCAGSTWAAELVANSPVAESYPPQIFTKILFTNKELCLAMPSKKISFNIKPFRVSGTNKVMLHLAGWNTALQYQY